MTASQITFHRLHSDVQRVVYQLGWTTLRPIQVAAIESFYQCLFDLLLIAPTAAGKTEAWLLPVLSSLMDNLLPSVQVLVVSPLKALVNDQHARIQTLALPLGIAVCGLHGVISQHLKQALKKGPRGILLITPESLDASGDRFPRQTFTRLSLRGR